MAWGAIPRHRRWLLALFGVLGVSPVEVLDQRQADEVRKGAVLGLGTSFGALKDFARHSCVQSLVHDPEHTPEDFG